MIRRAIDSLIRALDAAWDRVDTRYANALNDPSEDAPVVNGYRTRPRYGACPECHRPEDRWCDELCARLDLMDYR